MTKVWVAQPRNAPMRDYEQAWVQRISDEIRQFGTSAGFAVAEDSAAADVVLLIESAEYKTVNYIDTLLNDPLIVDHAPRICSINYDDHPEGMMAGIYTSIVRPRYSSELHRVWPVLFPPNAQIYSLVQEQIYRPRPKALFSFMGSESHALRRQLFSTFTSCSRYVVEKARTFYKHTEADLARFLEVSLDSVFCLCPRGYAAYTHRIAEVMAMGRVPVVIADDWIPFSFPSALPYYVRVPERDLSDLVAILEAQLPAAEALRRNGRKLWEENCSTAHRVPALCRIARELVQNGPKPTYDWYRERWRSRAFLKEAGWTSSQRIRLKIEQKLRWGVTRLRTLAKAEPLR